MPILLSLIAALSWGSGDYLGGVAAKRDNQYAVTFTRTLIELMLLILFVTAVGGDPSSTDLQLAVACGAIVAFVLPMFYGALSHGRMGVIAPVTGTVGAAIPVIIGIVSGERPSPLQIVGIVFAVVGIGLISAVKETEEEIAHRQSTLLLDVGRAAICGCAFGAIFTLLHHTSKASGAWPNFVMVAVALVLLGGFNVMAKKPMLVQRKNYVFNAWGALADISAVVSFTFATRLGFLSITAIVASLYPAITALLAWKFQNEEFDSMHKAGLAASVVSLVLITAGAS